MTSLPPTGSDMRRAIERRSKDPVQTNERLNAIRQRVLSSRYVADPDAETLHRESMSRTEGEPPVLREAKAIAHGFLNQKIYIQEGELIVGTRPGLIRDPAGAVKQAIFGRCVFAPPATAWWPAPESTHAFWSEGLLAGAGNHTTLDYDAVFSAGFDGLLRRVQERRHALSAEEPRAGEKRDFLLALRIVGDAYLDLSRRYADCALALSRAESSPARRRELDIIARNCRRVPARAPETFWEACQCAWFAFFFLPDAPGRLDQYLYPAYRREMDHGTLSRDFARELLSCLWLKYFESVGAGSGVGAHNHLTLGGVLPDGGDAANEVTELCLEVTEDLRLQRPQIGMRWNRNTPRGLLRRAVRVLRAKSGNPDFCNDEVIVPALERIGVSSEDARNFSLSGCHEVIVSGRAQMGSVEGFINLPKTLRMSLGLEPGLEIPRDLAAVHSFDELYARLETSMEAVAEAAHRSSVARDRAAADQPGGHLKASLVVRDCIEKACGYTQGGARYNFCNWNVIGVSNLADSLAALRQVVFADRSLPLPEFAAILARNWEGHEPLRHRLLNYMPHFGNDDPAVDALVARVIEGFSAILGRHTPFRGGRYILGTLAGGENMHVEFGRVTGATPDGRKAGETLADSIGAAQGRDRLGVTALLNSVARVPHCLLPTATTLNVKLDPRLIATEEGVDNVAALIRSHFESGGQQMQFNLVDREMLLAAKANPEQHADLIVRVAGYSAPFTSLWTDLQDEIIARTMQSPEGHFRRETNSSRREIPT